MSVTKKVNNQFITREINLFPGYIFVSFNPDISKWTVINNTFGVSKLIAFNNKPAEISFNLILSLKNRYQANSLHEKEKIEKGDRVKITKGPFVDFFAKIENIEANNRVWVLLEHNKLIQKLKLENEFNFIKL